jgi:hypothetical protein
MLQLQRPLQVLQSMTTRHTERSIIDLACRHQIQDYIRSHSTTVDVSVNKLEALVKERIQGVTNDSWSGQLSVCNTFNSLGERISFLQRMAVMSDSTEGIYSCI